MVLTASGDSVSTGHPVHDAFTGRIFTVHAQPSDIDACVSLSITRSLFYVVGILLVLTDIPRTGLAVNLSSYFATVGPGISMYYGPYAYPLVHLTRASSNLNTSFDNDTVNAFEGEERVDGVSVWAYKYDTLSIQTRALAEYLNVSSYPPCLLYEGPCDGSKLTTSVAFTILNDLMTAIQQRYFDSASTQKPAARFQTTSFWCDRLHHIFLGMLGCRLDHRIHSVRHYATEKSLVNGIDICRVPRASDRNRPTLCSLPIQWLTDHPTLGPAAQVPIQESIRLRVSTLQQRYPDALLEMVLITTNCPVQSLKPAVLPSVYYYSENLEVTTLIRGRRCPPGQPCRVEFIDDYRYERASIETSSDEFKFITGSLRALSQSYIWLRMTLLVWVCSQARLAEPSVRSSAPAKKAAVVMLTLLKIPSHVIIYSSWLPVIAYSLAHYVDCGVVHYVTDNFWASTNGIFAFDFVNFIIIASVQMRNVWFIALLWKVTVAIYSALVSNRYRAWRAQDGVFAFRAVFVGTISNLTTLSFMPSRRFRNTKVTEFIELPRHISSTKMQAFPPRSSSMSDFGVLQDVKTVFLASVFVFGVAFAVQTILRTYRGGAARFFACQNNYVPFTAGELFPTSALNVFWRLRLKTKPTTTTPLITSLRSSSVAPLLRVLSTRALAAVIPAQATTLSRDCEVCKFIPAPLYWQATQGCKRHEQIFSLGARPLEMQSMVRLVNIGMFCDPIVFMRLRVLGNSLRFYRITPRRQCAEQAEAATENSHVLTPATSKPWSPSQDHRISCELIAHFDSRFVPWVLLVDCG